MIRYLIIAAWFINYPGICQQKGVGSSTEAAYSEYNQVVKNQLHIFNGKEHKLYKSVLDEHPYFNSEDWTEAAVVYEGYEYKAVPILLDLSINKVIAQNPNTGSVFELADDKIDKITLGENVFVRLAPIPGAESGLYRLIYDGNKKLFARDRKKYEERISGTSLEVEFQLKSEYYLLVENNLVQITNKSALLTALGGKKNLPKFSNKGMPQYSTNKTENTYYQMVSFYDTK